MKISREDISKTSVKLHVTVSGVELKPIKDRVVKRLSKNIKLSGFRTGKAPQHLIERSIDQNVLQAEFFEEAVNIFGTEAIRQEQLRPVLQPNVELKKYVPFESIEFDVTVEVLGKIRIADYKKIKKAKPPVSVTDKDIDEVIEALRQRMAEKHEVSRAASEGDQVWIDFAGTDTKGKPISGGSGSDYPLILGSDTFIPGFEKNLIGLKAGQEKTFTLTFPKDYGVSALANKKVTFAVTVKKVEEVVLPDVNVDFVAKAGPFKSVDDLRHDISVQLRAERESRRDQEYENELIADITKKSTVELPKAIIDQQIKTMRDEERRNLEYRGKTWEEHLKEEGVSEEDHDDLRLRPQAEERLAGSFVLAEIAETEGLAVSDDELSIRLQLLRAQYGNDQQMKRMLDDLSYQREISSRMLTEKVVDRLVRYATE